MLLFYALSQFRVHQPSFISNASRGREGNKRLWSLLTKRWQGTSSFSMSYKVTKWTTLLKAVYIWLSDLDKIKLTFVAGSSLWYETCNWHSNLCSHFCCRLLWKSGHNWLVSLELSRQDHNLFGGLHPHICRLSCISFHPEPHLENEGNNENYPFENNLNVWTYERPW